MKQQTLAAAADQESGFEQYRRPTRRDEFLATMQTIVPWQELCAVIEPHYPKAGNGRPPVGLERMLRMYFVQHWFNLADEACEEALLDSTALRRFVGIDLGRERVPDGTTLLKFRRLLETYQLGEQLFAAVGQVLQERGLKVGTGTIVDATIIAAPSSTKNAQKALIESKAVQVRDFTNQRVRRGGEIDQAERGRNRNKSKIRARVEHVFAVVKRLWGFTKVRYRGLAKNATRSFVALGLANIYLARATLVA
jgi:IS5 family transposase